jgi:hypothetical protein
MSSPSATPAAKQRGPSIVSWAEIEIAPLRAKALPRKVERLPPRNIFSDLTNHYR